MLGIIKRSIALKIFFIFLGMLFVTSLMIYIGILVYMPRTFRNQVTKQFEEEFEQLYNDIQEDKMHNHEIIIQKFCNAHKTMVRLSSSGANGELTVLYEYGMAYLKDFSFENTTSIITKTIDGIDKDPALLITYAPTEKVNEVKQSLLSLCPVILVFGIILSFIGALICATYVSKPIIDISKKSKQMALLDLKVDWAPNTSRQDEIGILANSLEEMSDNLVATMEELNHANQLLQRDIVKEKQMEQERKDFFAAVSHELKTPITLLKCCVEGMIYKIGIYQDRDKYLAYEKEIIESLENMVAEILSVSKIEGTGYQLNPEKTNMGALVNSCCLSYEEYAYSRSVKLKCSVEEKIFCVVDSSLIKKAISNVINNAITYSPKGEEVLVRLTRRENQCMLKVENTGTQISEEAIRNLFNPFYRVDKSRSRNTGGSGLGLYIVKTILELHEAFYKIENIENGVCFTLRLEIM